MIKNFVKILELLGDRLEVCVSVKCDAANKLKYAIDPMFVWVSKSIELEFAANRWYLTYVARDVAAPICHVYQ